MQFLQLASEILTAITSRPARSRFAARTVLWGAAGILLAIGVVFGLMGLHALLAQALQPIAASFIMALAMILAAGLLALGAWLAKPPRPQHHHPEHEIALILAGFLQGLAGGTDASAASAASARAHRDQKDAPADPDH